MIRTIGILTAIGIGLAAPVVAEPGGYSHADQVFLMLMQDDPDYPFVITNFPVLRAQALRACRSEDNGMSGLDVVDQLAAEGPYSWDDANNIVSAAEVAYCPSSAR
jgi:hypothetical protein